jgi:hypothetical protein
MSFFCQETVVFNTVWFLWRYWKANILHEISKRKANWIGHMLRRNCFLQRVTEGKIQEGIEVTGRQGRRRRKLLVDLKERRGYSYLKEEALDRTMWRARFGRGFRSVVRQTTKWNELKSMLNLRTYSDIVVCFLSLAWRNFVARSPSYIDL